MSKEYFDVSNIRITPLKETWDGCHGLRISTCVADDKGLHIGPEIPIPDKATALDLLMAIHKALEAIGL